MATAEEITAMLQVSYDYESGRWVPSYYGNRFTVAKKQKGTESELCPTFRCNTLAEAQTEADRRNAA